MRSRLLAWAAAAVLIPLMGTGTAMADVAPGQVVGQTAASQQTANADADSTQVEPTNQNISVRVLSSGDDGAVTQSNTSAAEAAAANANATLQAAGQSAPADGTQAVGQEAQNTQAADASADSTQIKPTNQNVAVRVLSDGDNGDVSQENTSSAAALAANANKTAQVADQSGGEDGGGAQAVAQKAVSDQEADADATSVQDQPSNVNAPVRVLSEGDGGDVEQANTSTAKSAALNANKTLQEAAQDQGDVRNPNHVDGEGKPAHEDGEGCCESKPVHEDGEGKPNHVDGESKPAHEDGKGCCESKPAHEDGKGCGCESEPVHEDGKGCGCESEHGAAIQAIGQKADNRQDADADATSKQVGAKNVNVPVRVKSAGDDDGDVSQSNDSFAGAIAANKNATGQFAQQAQGDSGPGTVGIQAIGQLNRSDQDADADATSLQVGAENVDAPVRILSGGGGGGDVSQSNSSFAGALALNLNATEQVAQQDMGGGSGPLAIQATGQAAFNHQEADADASSFQLWPENVNTPVHIGDEKGHAPADHKGKAPDGKVPADHEGKAPDGKAPADHKGDAPYDEAPADAKSDRPYGDPMGERHAPARHEPMKGGDGSVDQANDSAALAAGLNANWTGQLAFEA
ncbi:MAG: hypothetical protein QOC64_3894 [Solirubrobacteraceae bacterium]|nr:hypothetical protein [Solirubrobacteraceae bacterium]